MARPITDRQFISVGVPAATAAFLLHFTYFWLDDQVRDHPGTLVRTLIEEGTAAYTALALAFLALRLWRAHPLRGRHVVRRLPLYVAGAAAFTLAHTTLMWATRTGMYALLGMGRYDYGRMPLRYLMEAPADLITFATIVAVFALVDEIVDRREHERTQAALERMLVATQLQNLRLQLQPHFLFNALNTIAARVYDDPAAADAMLGKLAELLRASLRSSDTKEVPLREELRLLDAYASLMRARFGSQLTITVDATSDLDDVLVPPLLLQPLVENAVRHGRLPRDGEARVEVTAARSNGRLTLSVRDDGPGIAAGMNPFDAGTGLSATARRLALVHGEAAECIAANSTAAGGGFEVTIRMPARTSVPA